ncbi:Histidine triad motif protein, partial [Metarhizium hybridum]
MLQTPNSKLPIRNSNRALARSWPYFITPLPAQPLHIIIDSPANIDCRPTSFLGRAQRSPPTPSSITTFTVPHVHYHVIPRPEIRASGRVSESFTMFGRGQRAELDDDEAAALAAGIRAEVARVLADDEGDGEDEIGRKAKL